MHCRSLLSAYSQLARISDGSFQSSLGIHRRSCGDWRLRRTLAEQLGAMAAAVSPQHVLDYLQPCAAALARDPVASVRSAAARHASALEDRVRQVEELASSSGGTSS